MPKGLLEAAVEELRHAAVADPSGTQETTRQLVLAAAERGGEDALYKGLAPDHLTASSFVFDESGTQTLLTFHRKGQFWVQLGGHLDRSDGSLRDAAIREFREESGIAGPAWFSPRHVEIDVHALSSGFSGCEHHLDVAFSAIVARDVEITISDESDDLAWWPLDGLPDGRADGLDTRLATAVAYTQPFFTR
jgi:8-oxo-dGTP pyrophosphatase MutT (NUDIX family)